MNVRAHIKNFLPPVVTRSIRKLLRSSAVRYEGSYRNWEAAAAACDGYGHPRILEQVSAATAAVESGKAVMERDGVMFESVQHSWPLLAGLLREAAANGGSLGVLDFGGSLGTTYRQCRSIFPSNTSLRWAVVEQPAFAEVGRRRFTTAELTFHEDPRSAVVLTEPSVLLLSSVLPYVRDPWTVLKDLLSVSNWSCVIIDRTPLWDAPDRLTAQHVPAGIYGTAIRYPAWILNASRLRDAFTPSFECAAEFDALSGSISVDGSIAKDTGLIMVRRSGGVA